MITLSYTIVVQIRCLCSPDIAVGKHLLFLVSGNQYQFLRILKQERKNATSCAWVWYQRPLDSRTRTTTSTRFDLKFFRVCSKYTLPGKLHFTFFTRKVSTGTLGEGCCALSRSQNACFRPHYIGAKTRSRMTTATTFSRQNDAGSRAYTTQYVLRKSRTPRRTRLRIERSLITISQNS